MMIVYRHVVGVIVGVVVVVSFRIIISELIFDFTYMDTIEGINCKVHLYRALN